MTLEVTDIMEILPHRYPMLLIDRIIELEPMKYAIGIKNATFNEQFSKATFRASRLCRASSLPKPWPRSAVLPSCILKKTAASFPSLRASIKIRFRHPSSPATSWSCGLTSKR